MSDYSKAIADAQRAGAAQHGDKQGAPAPSMTPVATLGDFGPTAPQAPDLTQDQGDPPPSGATTPTDEPTNVGPTAAQKPPQGKADAQQGFAQTKGGGY